MNGLPGGPAHGLPVQGHWGRSERWFPAATSGWHLRAVPAFDPDPADPDVPVGYGAGAVLHRVDPDPAVSLSLERPLDFSSLPTLLLLTTILRLSLNVATARLILSHGNEGPYAAGQVVAAFGSFLMGGDVVVGAIVFAMLLLVNFIVITKGSSRIAEVSARFYLDSMPGKQMAIDADLSSGTIDEPTARLRRAELSEESGFYGSMDGASKFVRGDAICALVITLINIFGGLAMGLIRAHMSVGDALSTFTTLTVGDGLVSQIPALLVSTAAGIVVSKGAIEGKMHGKLASHPTLTPDFRIWFSISHLRAARKSLALQMRGLDSFFLSTDQTTGQARQAAVER